MWSETKILYWYMIAWHKVQDTLLILAKGLTDIMAGFPVPVVTGYPLFIYKNI